MKRGAALALASVLGVAGVAAAEPTPQEKVLAQSLFEDGRAKMNAGNFAEACPKLAESYRLDPGGGTLLNLGLCHEGEGKLATAYAELGDALSRAIRDGRAERQKTAREHLAVISPKLSRLKLRVASTGPSDLKIEVDGIALARAAWDVAVPMDPGEHVIRASAEGKIASETKVTIEGNGSTAEVEVAALAVDPNAKPKNSPPPPPPQLPPPQPPPPESSGVPPLRILGFSSLALGGAGLLVGSIFVGLAASTWSNVHAECPNNVCSSASAVSDGKRAGTFADVATVSFIVGGVLAAAGVGLILFAPSPKRGAWLVPTPTGVMVHGAF